DPDMRASRSEERARFREPDLELLLGVARPLRAGRAACDRAFRREARHADDRAHRPRGRRAPCRSEAVERLLARVSTQAYSSGRSTDRPFASRLFGPSRSDQAATGTPRVMSTPTPKADLFGIPVDALTMAQVVERCRQSMLARERMLIGAVNAAKIVK